MSNKQVDITVEIECELLEKIKKIAVRDGLSAEQYISDIVTQYVKNKVNEHRAG